MSPKAMSLRLAENQAAELAAVARADGMPISEAIREAIDKHIAERKTDPDFQKSLKACLEEDQRVLERLAAGLGAKDDFPLLARCMGLLAGTTGVDGRPPRKTRLRERF